MLHKTRLVTVAVVALAFVCWLVRSEEESIMAGCSTGTFDAHSPLTTAPNSSCDGSFKTMFHSTQYAVAPGGTLDKEVTTSLASAKKVLNVFILAEGNSQEYKKRTGTSYIWIGSNTTPFSVEPAMTKSSTAIFDSGFYKLTAPTEGKDIVFRRQGPPSANFGDIAYLLFQLRAYQVPNLLLELQGKATISGPAPSAPGWKATNLITNLSSRTSYSSKQVLTDSSATLASHKSCFKTNSSILASQGNKMVLTINLLESFFQHAVLFVQDLDTGWFANEGGILLENVSVYIGDNPDHTKNVACPGGPYMVVGNSNSYRSVNIGAFLSYTGYNGDVWNFGQEVWCNLPGQYITLVSDMNHKLGQLYEISLCQLAVFGTVYVRVTPLPAVVELFMGSTTTIRVEKIFARADYAIGNTHNIMLRQKVGSAHSWVTFTQEVLVTVVNIAPDSSVTLGDHTLVLESFDLDGGVKSALKTDVVTVRWVPLECREPLSHVFDTQSVITIIKEYMPTIYFPEKLFAGPHTYTGFNCGGTYTQSITVDSPLAGVVLTVQPTGPDLRPSITIDGTAAAGTSFTLTFRGRYVHTPTLTDISGSFTQKYQLRTVFSPDYLSQPTITHSLTATDLTFSVPPAAVGAPAPTQTLTGTFAVAYAIKTGTRDSLGNLPPAITPDPFAGFTSAQLVKQLSSLGTTTLTNPRGSLNAVSFAGNLNPGTNTISFSCDPWTRGSSGSSISKALVFKNSEQSSFGYQLEVTCAYTTSTPPSFAAALEPVVLTANEPKLLELPQVAPGTFSLASIRFEPDAALAEFLTFTEATRSVSFNGNSKSLSLAGSQLSIKFVLVDSVGVESASTQVVTITGCQATKTELDILQASLSATPLLLQVQAGLVAFSSTSYTREIALIKSSVSYARAVCGDITVELVSRNAFLQHDVKLQTVTLFSDEKSEAGTYKDSFLRVSLHSYTLKIPVDVSFVACTLTYLAFEEQTKSVAYNVGSGTLEVSLPATKQKPDCKLPFNKFIIESIESSIAAELVRAAVSLSSGSQSLTIAADDVSMIGKTARLMIKINQTVFPNAKPLFLVINFTNEPPRFDFRAFEAKPLTCSLNDRSWHLQLPPVVNPDVDTVGVELVGASGTSSLLSLSGDQLALVSGASDQLLLRGEHCLSKEIRLNFTLSSPLRGTNNQTISIPVQKAASESEGTHELPGADMNADVEGGAVSQKTQFTSNVDKKVKPAKDVAKLMISAVKISPSGELTITFSQPIVPPPIRPRKETAAAGQRRSLGDETLHEIERVISFKIERDEDQVMDQAIADVSFIKADNVTLTCQIDFSEPSAISKDIKNPDTLELLFLIPEIFVDQRTGRALDGTSWTQKIKVQQQFTVAEYEEFKSQAQTAASVGVAVSIWELLMLFFFQKILFSMWVLILTLQILVYIGVWQIRYPHTTHFILYELKRVTLGEFMDDFQFGKKIADALAIESDDKSSTEEKLGKERLGTLSGSIGVTIIVVSIASAVLVSAFVLFIVLCRRCQLSEKGKACLRSLKKKLYLGPFIRYAYLNSLKLNLASFAVLANSDQKSTKDLVVAIIILIVINLAPLLFLNILRKHRSTLDEENTRAAYGALYLGKT